MAKTRPFTSNFTRGEVSAYINGRPDIGPYYNGCKRLENYIVLPEGGAIRRKGTIVVAEVKDSSKETILMPFSRSQNLSYIAEAGDQYMRFYRNGERIALSGGAELVTNGTFNTDLTGWTDVSTGGAQFRWRSAGAAGGAAQLNNVGPGSRAGGAQQVTGIINGGTYQFRFDDTGAQPFTFNIGGGASIDDLIPETTIPGGFSGSYLYTFVANSTQVNIWFRRPDDGTTQTSRFDNVSLVLVSSPYEIATPYLEAHLNEIHRQQSIDVLYLNHGSYPQRKLQNFSDNDFRLVLRNPDPPPSFEDDTDISEGTVTLTPTATTGEGVTFNLSASKALAGDVRRQIVGTLGGLANITAQGGTTYTADIIEAFPSTVAIPAGQWKLRLSPQTTFDPDKKGPVGAITTVSLGAAAIRGYEMGKFVKVYGGVLQTISIGASLKCKILSVLNQSTDDNPTAAPAGSWRLEVPKWSAERGYPKTLEFHQGRLDEASTDAEPTTVWGSASDNFDNFAVGSLAADAYEFTVRSGKANAITWLASVNELMMGEENNAAPIQPLHIGTGIRFAKGPGVDAPIGGDVIPYITTVKGQLFYVDSTRTEIRQLRYNLEQDGIVSTNLNILGRHLFDPKEGGSRIKQAALAYAEKPNSIIYILREDGQLIALTIYDQEQVLAFSRIITDGQFESVAVIPNGESHQVWVIVRRDINGQVKRYVEYFNDNANDRRRWSEVYTDCAKIINQHPSATPNILTGLDHLEGKNVAVVFSIRNQPAFVPRYLGAFTVTGGSIDLGETLDGPADFEIGLPYTPVLQLMRTAIPNVNLEGKSRKADKVFARFKDTVGCTLNGEEFIFDGNMNEGPTPFTGLKDMLQRQGWSTQDEPIFSMSFPGPQTILGITGEVSVEN